MNTLVNFIFSVVIYGLGVSSGRGVIAGKYKSAILWALSAILLAFLQAIWKNKGDVNEKSRD